MIGKEGTSNELNKDLNRQKQEGAYYRTIEEGSPQGVLRLTGSTTVRTERRDFAALSLLHYQYSKEVHVSTYPNIYISTQLFDSSPSNPFLFVLSCSNTTYRSYFPQVFHSRTNRVPSHFPKEKELQSN